MLEQFDWKNWSEEKVEANVIRYWLASFEQDYFTRRDRNPKSETTWAKDYLTPFNKLPPDEPLTAEILIATTKTYPPDTRSRKRACSAYGALAKFADLSVDLSPLRGSYRPTAVRREDVPDDDLIMEWADRIPDPRWLNFYRLVATYGLRNHEAFYVDLTQLKIDPIAVVKGGKTGYRAVSLPCPKAWWEEWFAGQDIAMPTVMGRSNSHYGNVSSQYFKRLGLPFHIYDLRHAHAGRMALKGIDPSIAARSQGHSLKVHSEIYLNFLNADSLRTLLDQL